jgi:hypothetical protein
MRRGSRRRGPRLLVEKPVLMGERSWWSARGSGLAGSRRALRSRWPRIGDDKTRGRSLRWWQLEERTRSKTVLIELGPVEIEVSVPLGPVREHATFQIFASWSCHRSAAGRVTLASAPHGIGRCQQLWRERGAECNSKLPWRRPGAMRVGLRARVRLRRGAGSSLGAVAGSDDANGVVTAVLSRH